jgi:hypothetical protein
MKSVNPKRKNPEYKLKLALIVSFAMFVLCLIFCLETLNFRAFVETQRIHPTPTPELYKNFLDVIHYACFVVMPAMGVLYLVIANCIWQYRREVKKPSNATSLLPNTAPEPTAGGAGCSAARSAPEVGGGSASGR